MHLRGLLSVVLLAAGTVVFTAPSAQAEPYYANCAEVRAAGAAPLFRGQPGYRAGLDRDNDGVACEVAGDDPTPPPGPPTPPPGTPAAAMDVVRYSWAPDLYSVTFYSSGWVWKHLTFDDWAKTGFKAPRYAGWIEGTEIFKYATADELFATLNGAVHRLTLGEWQDMGFRQPTNVNGGYVKLSWAPAGIAFTNGTTSTPVSYDAWAQAQFPTPQARGFLPGDYICSYTNSSVLVYFGVTRLGDALTYEQWTQTGFMSPRVC